MVLRVFYCLELHIFLMRECLPHTTGRHHAEISEKRRGVQMELSVNRQSVMINEIIFNGCAEQSIESDVLLADYCPDIVRILKCSVQPKIEAAQLNAGKIVIDGSAQVKVFYCTQENRVFCYRSSVPFQKNIELKHSCEEGTVHVMPKTDYVNCRAVSSRRLEIKGAVSLNVKALGSTAEEFAAESHEMGIQLKKTPYRVNQPIKTASGVFFVQETLELGYGKPSVSQILDCRAEAQVSDFKPIANKVITKGELQIQLSYYCGEGKLQFAEHSIPVSSICDVEKMSEDTSCSAVYQVVECNAEIQPSSDGENRRISIECKIRCDVAAHKMQEYLAVTDCFSTQYECRADSKDVTLAALEKKVEQRHLYRETITLPEKVAAVGDVWCTAEEIVTEWKDDKMLAAVKMNICLFSFDESGTPELYERTEDINFEVQTDASISKAMFMGNAYTVSASYGITSSDRLEIRCDLLLYGGIYTVQAYPMLKSIEVDAENPKQTRKRSPLTIYYADKGESVWNIARRYNTVPDSIMEENNLQQDIMSSRRMLLIPTM